MAVDGMVFDAFFGEPRANGSMPLIQYWHPGTGIKYQLKKQEFIK